MEKTFLFGTNSGLSLRTQKGIAIVAALVFLANGVVTFLRGSTFSMVLGVLLLLVGIYFCVQAAVLFSSDGRYAPKLVLSEEGVRYSQQWPTPATRLRWADITALRIRPYMIEFEMGEACKSLAYAESGEKADKLRKSLAEYARGKGIAVTAD